MRFDPRISCMFKVLFKRSSLPHLGFCFLVKYRKEIKNKHRAINKTHHPNSIRAFYPHWLPNYHNNMKTRGKTRKKNKRWREDSLNVVERIVFRHGKSRCQASQLTMSQCNSSMFLVYLCVYRAWLKLQSEIDSEAFLGFIDCVQHSGLNRECPCRCQSCPDSWKQSLWKDFSEIRSRPGVYRHSWSRFLTDFLFSTKKERKILPSPGAFWVYVKD